MTAHVIAEAVRDALDAETFTQSFAPGRKPLPKAELADLGTLSVTVVPRSDARSNYTRGSILREFTIDIGIQKRLAAASDPELETANTEVDALGALVEEIAAFFEPGLLGVTGAAWVETLTDPIYDPAHLRDQKVFTSVVTVKFDLQQTR